MAAKFDIVPLNDWGFFHLPPRPCVVAGPCSAESEEQVMETARGLKAIGINVFRAGIWKPRTHPGSFEGAGVPGLKWMQKVRKEYGMRICTEVANERHVFECLKEAGVSCITYMPTRNTPAQLERLRGLCRQYGMFEVSGEDINTPRQSFVIKAMENPMFANLIEATWKLIEHEKNA